jgi:hypothetical protein
MPSITCAKCGQRNLILFASVDSRHCSGCGVALPVMPPGRSPALASRVLEEAKRHNGLTRSASPESDAPVGRR